MAEIIRRHGAEFRRRCGGVLCGGQERVLRDLAACRTAVLGGHLYRCDACGHEVPLYNSCGNRHCPQCHAAARARWFAAREQELLPLPYFHAVFTLPHELTDVARANRRVVYGLLFRAAAETLLQLAADPQHLGARIGILAVLHTWGQRLEMHPHVHLIVTGGGLSAGGDRWIACPQEDFLLPLGVVSAKYRGKFLDLLRRAQRAGRLKLPATLGGRRQWQALVKRLYAKRWVVYLKPPFGGPQQVLKYLARYTHRVAICDQRLISLRAGQVTFAYKDYRRGGRWEQLKLPAVEFLQRFLQHVLPKGLVRIRSYGIWSNRHRGSLLPRCRQLLGDAAAQPTVQAESAEGDAAVAGSEPEPQPPSCPHCGQASLQQVARYPRPTLWMPMALPFPFDTSYHIASRSPQARYLLRFRHALREASGHATRPSKQSCPAMSTFVDCTESEERREYSGECRTTGFLGNYGRLKSSTGLVNLKSVIVPTRRVAAMFAAVSLVGGELACRWVGTMRSRRSGLRK